MLGEKLQVYAKQEIYPFHMPGHKRVSLDEWNSYEMDITEIDGFDNLHHAEDILKVAQDKAAQIYGAKKSFYLINGSTCGILTALSALVSKRGKILVARNSHKSVYHGIFLRELDAVYVYPELTDMGLQGQVNAEKIEALLQVNKNIEAVMITSPTYDGIVSDVETIATVVHAYGIPLIVDAAHGAHFGFTEDFPENPVRLGADLVIESVHKTLPAFTQTALLHVCSDRVNCDKIKKYLSIYETSSPSYILMAGIDRCMEYMKQRGVASLKVLKANLDEFYEMTAELKHLKVLQKGDFSSKEAYDFDNSKVLIFSKSKEVSGTLLHEILLEKYHLQMEMASGQYVLALCTLMDQREGFQRLAQALKEIDNSDIWKETTVQKYQAANIYREQWRFLPIYKMEEYERIEVNFEQAVEKVSAEYLFLYPPGIPFLVPGEVITEEVIADIRNCQAEGLEVMGLTGKNGIFVVNF